MRNIHGDMKLKMTVVLTLMVCTMTSASEFNSCEWIHYLGNPHRTGYSPCAGPDTPEIFWEMSAPGDIDISIDIDTPPFIQDTTVLILWGDTIRAKIFYLDILTGEIQRESKQLDSYPSRVFPVNDKIIGEAGEKVLEIDSASGITTILAEIPEKGSPLYPVVLEDRIIIPSSPPVCLSTSDFDTVWNLEGLTNPNLRTLFLAADESLAAFLMIENGVPHLFTAESSSGVIQWMSDPLPAARWLTVGEDAVYCGGKNVWAFDGNGVELWEFAPQNILTSNIVLTPDALYVVDEGGTLYKIDLNGNSIWKTQCKVSPWYYETHLVGSGKILYCIANFGEGESMATAYVTAFNMEDGSVLWDLNFGPSTYVKAAPAVAHGILIVRTVNGDLIALASDPELFVKQGDILLSNDNTGKAVNSYRKAAELFENKGDISKAQEIQNRIQELENQPRSSTPASPEQTPLPESPLPEQSTRILIFAGVLFAGILAGILIIYYISKRKNLDD